MNIGVLLKRPTPKYLLGLILVLMLGASVLIPLGVAAKDVVSVGPNGRFVEDAFFGMHLRYGATRTPWPDAPFYSWRVITPGTAWFGLQPHEGQWRVRELDRAVEVAEQHGVEVLLTLGQTPRWAATRPDEVVRNGAGASSEPARMQDWEHYVRTVARRYKGRIKYYELWNEPRFREIDPYRVMPGFTGYAAQMVDLGRVAKRAIGEEDPAAVLISPSMDGGLPRVEQWFKSGGGEVAPILAVHLYVRPPERMVKLYRDLKMVTRRFGYPAMPIWNTEAGYLVFNPDKIATLVRPGSDDVFAKMLTPEELAAYMVRAHILTAAAGLDRFYWYSWDILDMGLTRSFGKTPMIGSIAYGTMLKWLRGTTIDRCVTENDKTWLCYIRRGGETAYVVWNGDDEIDFDIPSEMQVGELETVEGKIMPVSGKRIRVGMSPVLLKALGISWLP